MSRKTDETPSASQSQISSSVIDSPIDPAIVQRASEWMARLWSGEASDDDKAACEQWRAVHPDHERAWNRLQLMEDKLHSIPREIARHALREPAVTAYTTRRQALKLLGLITVAGGAMYQVRESDTWEFAFSDYSTQTGEIREIALVDGTHIILNTATAIDVYFDNQERRIILRSGEILITTAPDYATAYRPFRVQSRQGMIEALGTRFIVRQDADVSRVTVFEGAVGIHPEHAIDTAVRVDAGQHTTFSVKQVMSPITVQESTTAWSRGVLVAENMRIADFLAELSRYRSGLLRCDSAVADLRVTGVFPLHDTDRALLNLTLGLPVRVVYRTRYWVTVQAQ